MTPDEEQKGIVLTVTEDQLTQFIRVAELAGLGVEEWVLNVAVQASQKWMQSRG